MDAVLGERPISFKALFDFSKLDGQDKKHLKNVYASLAISTLSAAVGGLLFLFTELLQGSLGLLLMLGSIGFLLALGFTEHDSKNHMKRLGYLVGFAFCSGVSLGPLMGQVTAINPTIVPTAFLAACLIFVCFSLTALWAEDRKFLYMGGTLMSGLLVLTIFSFLNLFLGMQILYQIQLYGGLILFCAFILYDTQLIVEKRRRGDKDFIWHSVDLFLDFINIFRRLMIILANKESNKKKRKD